MEILQILPLLSVSSSRFLSNLELTFDVRTPYTQVPQLISKFSGSLTVLTIREIVKDYTDNVKGIIFDLIHSYWILSETGNSLLPVCYSAVDAAEEKTFDLSPDEMEQGLSIMLWSMKLKHVRLWLTLDFDPDGTNYSALDLLDAFSLAFSRAFLSSPAKLESLDFCITIPCLMPAFLAHYWTIAEERQITYWQISVL